MSNKIKKFSKKYLAGLKRDVKSGFSPGWVIGGVTAALLLPAASSAVVGALIVTGGCVAGCIVAEKVVKTAKNHKGSLSNPTIAKVTAPARFVGNKAKSGLGNVASIGNKFKAATSKDIASLKSSVFKRGSAPKPPKAA